MRPKVLTTLFTVLAATAANAAIAEAPLGITAAEFRLGAVQQDTGAAQASLGDIKSTDEWHPSLGFAAVNVAITQHHGFQGDALLEDGPDGAIGRVAGHLFMTPKTGQKYGVFAMLADVDGESVTYGTGGVEGILSFGGTSIEVRGGIGMATAKDLDWITIGTRVSRELGAAVAYVDWNATEFEEADIDTIAHDITMGFDVKITKTLGAFLAVTKSTLNGTEAADESTLRAGVTITLGKFGGTDAHTQAFHTADPVSQLIRRGYF